MDGSGFSESANIRVIRVEGEVLGEVEKYARAGGVTLSLPAPRSQERWPFGSGRPYTHKSIGCANCPCGRGRNEKARVRFRGERHSPASDSVRHATSLLLLRCLLLFFP
jgi:hypothetical protein